MTYLLKERYPGLSLALLAVWSAAACSAPPVPQQAINETASKNSHEAVFFHDAAADSGLDFVHVNGGASSLHLAEITCAGGGMADIDGDGDLDIYLSQGQTLGPGPAERDSPLPPRHPPPLSDRLYRNDMTIDEGGSPALRFTDITESSSIAEATQSYGCGVAAADFDGDGNVDLFVLSLGPNRLLRGRGDGTFEDVTRRAGIESEEIRSSVAASIADFDRDGRLDIFVANNLDFVYDPAPSCRSPTGALDYCGPSAFAAERDTLWLGRGRAGMLRFEDATEASGLATSRGPALGVIAADFDQDGWQDLYVAQDGEPNLLWHNNGSGDGATPTFEEIALVSGAALNGEGAAEASMGVGVGDYDRDGDVDLFLAHLTKETNTLYRNDGSGRFDDRSRASSLAAPSLAMTAFGTGFVDVDGDGWLDIVAVNGAVTLIEEQVRHGERHPLRQPNQLFLSTGANGGEVRFVDASARGGPDLARSEVSRAAVFGDIDNDGDIDVLVVNNGGPLQLLLNQTDGHSGWLGLRLVGGPDAARDMLGARATIIAPDGQRQTARAHTDGSYNASRDPRLLFGLGPPTDEAFEVTVTWPSGSIERFESVVAGRYTTLHQGEGKAAR